jgi:hypothetical protein
MDPFHLALALGPLSVYLLLIGRINLSRRPFVTTGARDTFALAMATSGLFAAGPLELFMPEGAAGYLGGWVWCPLLGLYVLCSLLAAMLMRPRLLVYNISTDQLHPVLELVGSRLDPDRRWAGGSLLLPNLGLQLIVEPTPLMRHVQLTAAGSSQQDLNGWRRLEAALNESLRSVRVPPNPRGFSMIALGAVMAAVILLKLNRQPEVVAQALNQFLRR